MSIPAQTYKGSTFREVRDQLMSDPYEGELPTYEITLGSFFGVFRNKLFAACKRTLNDPSDLLPHPGIQKLVHPLGIALMGKWKIEEDNPYTGCFTPGFEALTIVRCSVLLFDTRQGNPRGFAFAAKLFPTLDPDERVETVDLFTIDVLAGTLAKHFTDVELTNEPPLGFNSYVNRLFWVVLVTFVTFFRANYNPVFRPLWRLGKYGVKPGETSNFPEWIMIKADPDCGKVDRVDLRDELRVENYKDGRLRFNISVAPKALRPGGQKDWRRIGQVELTESVTSYTCDHRLVYNHPKLENLP